MSDPAANKALIRKYAEAFSEGSFRQLESLFTPDAQIQGVLGFGGLDLALPIWRELHAAFHVKLAIESLVAEDDVVAARYTESGTFTAPFRNLPPTGMSYAITAMEFFQITAGKISRRWGARDSAAMFRQLQSPPPAAPAPAAR
jgi:predicted ester cyclase